MNAPIEKSLSARAMDWRIDPWRALRVDYGKEADVTLALALEPYSAEAFLPVEIRTYSIIRGRRHPPRPWPLLPSVVFARLELSTLSTVRRDVEPVTGWLKDAQGFPQAIPDREMEEFRIAYQTLMDETRAKLALGQALSREEKTQWRDLKDGLKEILNRMDAS